MTPIEKLIEAVKRHALINYENDGWDFVVECYVDENIAVIINEEGAVSASEAIAAVGKIVKFEDEYRKEIEATIF